MNSATFISKRWFAPMSISVNGNVVPVLDNISAFLFFFSLSRAVFLIRAYNTFDREGREYYISMPDKHISEYLLLVFIESILDFVHLRCMCKVRLICWPRGPSL